MQTMPCTIQKKQVKTAFVSHTTEPQGGFIFSNPKKYLYLDWVLLKIHITTGGAAMKQNIHNVERIIRVVLGLIILSLVFVGPKSLWGLIGILPIMTGLIGWCPPYQLLGISTCKK
ncbi:DUF2892 domain-containing protein [Thermodesulfobacteriota bacterium]